MTELETNPQDPYKSLIVRASAGSGKTFQLSRRFLALVTAGADPSQILTITFSRKAAAEMRARVIADAISYGKQNQDFHGFYRNIERWRQQALIKGLTPPPLISPEKVSAAIVQNTQSLAITTIDAILMEWCLKFPIETEQVTEQDFIGSENADPVKSCTVALRAPWEIASKSDQERQHLAAWQQTLHQLSQGIPVEDRSSFFQQLLAATPGNQFKSGWKRLEHLIKSDTFIWLSEHVRGDARLFYDLAGEDVPTDEYELLAVIRTPLMRVISEIGSAEKKQLASAALADGNFPALIAAGIFKQDLTFNGTTISKKVRTAVSEFIDDVELVMTAYRNNQQLRRLNAHAKLLWVFYHTWNNEYLKARSRAGNGIFSDALKGVYALFSGEFAGARWLIQNQVKHLMLDEFQDTSRLQWSVFSGLAKDLQSGQTQDPNDLSGTVFIVGDAKQSIYGFREAAPEIVDVAAEDLKPLGMHPVEMSSSWRTADIVLEVVNEVFRNNPFMENFPVHSGARTAKGPVNIDCGSFHILPLAMMSGATAQEGQAQEIRPEFRPEVKIEYNADELESDSEVTIEATQVVEHIEHCISGLVKTPIWDKSQNKFRNPLPRDFVILYSKSTHAHAYEAALREKKIGALREEQRGFFGRQEIKDALCFLRWIAFPTDTASLCGLLRSPFCNISDRTLQALISPEEYIASDNIGDKTKDKINDKIEGKSRLNPSSFQILNRLANFEMSDLKSNNFAKLLQKALVNLSSPYVTLAKFIRESDGLRRYRGLFGPIEGPLAEANLVKLLDQIRQAGAQGISTFQALLLYLEERASDDDLGNAAGTEEAVRLMTVHKSKGLEFPIVILVDTANDWFKAETYWLRSPKLGAEGFRFIGTKSERPELDPQIVSALSEHEEVQRAEKARLLYVAMTRAKQHLVVSGRFKPKVSQPSPKEDSFYGVLTRAALKLGARESAEGVRIERLQPVLALNLAAPNTHKAIGGGGIQPNGALDSLKDCFGPTVISNSGDAPRSPLPKFILPALSILNRNASPVSPKIGNEKRALEGTRNELAAVYGTAVHRCLEILVNGEKPDIERVLSFSQSNQAKAAMVPPEEIRKICTNAIQDSQIVLESDAWKELFIDVKSKFTELPFAIISHDLSHDLSPILNQDSQGKMEFKVGQPDLILEKSNNEWWIIDYKTTTQFADKISSPEPRAVNHLQADLLNAEEFAGSTQEYESQLSGYREGLTRLLPMARIRTFVLFTRQNRLIEII